MKALCDKGVDKTIRYKDELAIHIAIRHGSSVPLLNLLSEGSTFHELDQFMQFASEVKNTSAYFLFLDKIGSIMKTTVKNAISNSLCCCHRRSVKP